MTGTDLPFDYGRPPAPRTELDDALDDVADLLVDLGATVPRITFTRTGDRWRATAYLGRDDRSSGTGTTPLDAVNWLEHHLEKRDTRNHAE